jgi:hypothetical protein
MFNKNHPILNTVRLTGTCREQNTFAMDSGILEAVPQQAVTAYATVPYMASFDGKVVAPVAGV